jgi:hypothetical protein
VATIIGPVSVCFSPNRPWFLVMHRPLLARNGRAEPIWRCPLTGVDRKWLADRQTAPIDPKSDIGLTLHVAVVFELRRPDQCRGARRFHIVRQLALRRLSRPFE